MKVFKNLTIDVPQTDWVKFIELVEGKLDDGWKRDVDAEARAHGLSDGVSFYFVCNKKSERRKALVAILGLSSSGLSVVNVVPADVGSLSHDEYNLILDEFTTRFISPVCDELGFDFILTSDDQSIDDWISPETAKILKAFSGLANKSTGSSHPSDQKLWFDFIISVHLRNETELWTDRLNRWLQQDGWPKENAFELVVEYETALELLKQYDAKIR